MGDTRKKTNGKIRTKSKKRRAKTSIARMTKRKPEINIKRRTRKIEKTLRPMIAAHVKGEKTRVRAEKTKRKTEVATEVDRKMTKRSVKRWTTIHLAAALE